MTKWVYSFGAGSAEGRADMKALLGGKGANLAEMSNLGLPVPPGFTITTEVRTYFYKNGRCYPADTRPAVEAALARVAGLQGARFGGMRNLGTLPRGRWRWKETALEQHMSRIVNSRLPLER